MKSNIKPYKKNSSLNRKKKKGKGEESGYVDHSNSSKSMPIIALPEVNQAPIVQSYRRFVNNSSATVSQSLTISDLLKQFTFAISATQLYPYIQAVRLKKIRILSPVTTQGTSVTLLMSPQAQDTGQNCFVAVPEVYVDTSASIDVPAYLDLSPSIDTPLGSWHYATSVDLNLLQVSAPAGSTLDLLLEYILNIRVGAGTTYTRTVAAATPGAVYAGAILNNTFAVIGANSI